MLPVALDLDYLLFNLYFKYCILFIMYVLCIIEKNIIIIITI